MANDTEEKHYEPSQENKARGSGWLKVGAVAAASALAGGLAAAWWYRKTLKTLRQSGENPVDPHFSSDFDEVENQADFQG